MKTIVAAISAFLSVWFLADGILSRPIQLPAARFHESTNGASVTTSAPQNPVDVVLADLNFGSRESSVLQIPRMSSAVEHDGIRFTGKLKGVDSEVETVVLFVECFRQFKDTIQIIESSTQILNVVSGTGEVHLIMRSPAYAGEYTVTMVAVAESPDMDLAETAPTVLASGTMEISQ